MDRSITASLGPSAHSASLPTCITLPTISALFYTARLACLCRAPRCPRTAQPRAAFSRSRLVSIPLKTIFLYNTKCTTLMFEPTAMFMHDCGMPCKSVSARFLDQRILIRKLVCESECSRCFRIPLSKLLSIVQTRDVASC